MILALLVLAALACTCAVPSLLVPRTETPGDVTAATIPSFPTESPFTPTPADTPTPVESTLVVTPGETASPTPLPAIPAVPTSPPRPASTPAPTTPPTGVVGPPVGNRFRYAGFEEFRSVTGPEGFLHQVSRGWHPFYCDGCPAERIGNGNPEGLLMGRPTYEATNISGRVHSGGLAQQWYCFYYACRAGVYQTVETAPGEVCDVSAWVQSWSANGTGLTSDLVTQDDRDNSQWRIMVDPTGGTYAFAASGLLVSRVFGYDDGIYDKYVQISYTFTATSAQATIFFENLRLWPIANNDNYIDDASVICHAP